MRDMCTSPNIHSELGCAAEGAACVNIAPGEAGCACLSGWVGDGRECFPAQSCESWQWAGLDSTHALTAGCLSIISSAPSSCYRYGEAVRACAVAGARLCSRNEVDEVVVQSGLSNSASYFYFWLDAADAAHCLKTADRPAYRYVNDESLALCMRPTMAYCSLLCCSETEGEVPIAP